MFGWIIGGQLVPEPSTWAIIMVALTVGCLASKEKLRQRKRLLWLGFGVAVFLCLTCGKAHAGGAAFSMKSLATMAQQGKSGATQGGGGDGGGIGNSEPLPLWANVALGLAVAGVGVWVLQKRQIKAARVMAVAGLLVILAGVSAQRVRAAAALRLLSPVALQNPPVVDAPDLANVLYQSVVNLAAGKDQGDWGFYDPLTLATNQNVWTWPLSFSCIGVSDATNSAGANFEQVLIAPNLVLGDYHFDALTQGLYNTNHYATFTDTNGVRHSRRFVGAYGEFGSMEIGILESNLPSSVVPAHVLPPTWTNYFYDPSINGLIAIPTVWAHHTSGTMDIASVLPYLHGMLQVQNDDSLGVFGTGLGATGGDSASPVFLVISNTPVLMMTVRMGDTNAPCGGDFISDAAYYNWAQTVTTNALSTVDLSAFKTYR